ncbi:hypothetical protein GCM10025331_48380 [Actinoplanes utahensis]|nr:hypothetical protein Aut01nite_57260 [Actinoplanes utahensis]
MTVFVEGEEEYGSASLERLLTDNADVLDPDVIVIADSDNWDIGRPAPTTSLRGTVSLLVEVRPLRAAVHSGMFGGPAPDARTVLTRLLSTLHDDDGAVAVPGLTRHTAATVDYPEERFRAEAGVLRRGPAARAHRKCQGVTLGSGACWRDSMRCRGPS